MKEHIAKVISELEAKQTEAEKRATMFLSQQNFNASMYEDGKADGFLLSIAQLRRLVY
jgi:hypothetical protein